MTALVDAALILTCLSFGLWLVAESNGRFRCTGSSEAYHGHQPSRHARPRVAAAGQTRPQDWWAQWRDSLRQIIQCSCGIDPVCDDHLVDVYILFAFRNSITKRTSKTWDSKNSRISYRKARWNRWVLFCKCCLNQAMCCHFVLSTLRFVLSTLWLCYETYMWSSQTYKGTLCVCRLGRRRETVGWFQWRWSAKRLHRSRFEYNFPLHHAHNILYGICSLSLFIKLQITASGMFAIRAERDYIIEEDLMKAVRKVAENKKLESKLDYKPV